MGNKTNKSSTAVKNAAFSEHRTRAFRKRCIIVDGFNVLRSGSRYKEVRGPNPDYDSDWYNRAREMLLNDVAQFAGSAQDATVVFDGGGNTFSQGEVQMVGGIAVRFSAAGQTADTLIERLAFERRRAGCEVLVVTSDAAIQDTVLGLGADRMSAEGFCIEIERARHEATLEDVAHLAHKRTLGERIDPETLAKLKALRTAL